MRAFVVSEIEGALSLEVLDQEVQRTDPSDIIVDVEYSAINFKDALVASPKSRVRRLDRLVGGVDASGTVRSSSHPAIPVGARVAVHGGVMGVARDGGFAQQVAAPPMHISLLPESISTRDAMVIGTAGFTAMQSILALEDFGVVANGEILVTGATGGVGSQAVTYLALRGFKAVASTGSVAESQWLLDQGASRIIGRDEVSDKPDRVLGTQLWDGAIDCVGGSTLGSLIRSLKYGCAVAASGLVASADLATTVYPFITRATALIGIDAVEAPASTRQRVWEALGTIAPRVDFSSLIDSVLSLEELPTGLDQIRNGKTRGRILVNPTPGLTE